jgi:hypothetical protein
MFGKNPQNDESRRVGIDRLGTLVLRAAAADEQEIEAASTAPFLFTRIRARIAEARREESTGWQSLPLIAWRAIPAMALIAMLAGGLTIWTAEPTSTPVGFGIYEEALADTTNPGIEQAVLNQNSLSSDDVLTIVVERGNRENKK